jgi:hypothetical protein
MRRDPSGAKRGQATRRPFHLARYIVQLGVGEHRLADLCQSRHCCRTGSVEKSEANFETANMRR